MAQTAQHNRQIVLAQRPAGAPDASTFRLETSIVPTPGPGQMLLRTLWLSLDPYMRGRLNEGPSYADPVAVNGVMCGGTVSRVEASNVAGYAVGDLVHSYAGWQDYALSDGSDVIIKLPAGATHPSHYLGVLGMPGFTAWHGLTNIGKPKKGETFVTAGATGAVGQISGQLAKQAGCRVVGIAGGAAKCDFAVKELGFDACIDHHAPDFAAQLAAACPNGIDIYFENVGGTVWDAVLPLFNLHARVPVCGLIAHYNGEGFTGADRLPGTMFSVLVKRLTFTGFIIFDQYPTYYGQFLSEMTNHLANGTVNVREDVVASLEDAPAALTGLLAGKNFGKVVVEVAGG
ncbi:NADP-dependent oxidoreductase [Nevskia sp.]|uniref:NADP-dependent oxidoreductase n=1 Tax=Nevskia sp. TaxID=1929292 RepID=UPI0025F1F2B2|nr:NADP-dependent oxidoreductase [Nevskia sp.]